MARVLVLICLFLTNVSPCGAEAPELFREPSFNAATLAEAVNHFVAIGEDASVREMAALGAGQDLIEVHPAGRPPLADVDVPANHGSLRIHQRIGWVCRVLFIPKGRKPLRPPQDGYYWMLPYDSLPLERWPLFPLALSGSTFFVLSEATGGSGIPERPVDYIDYCRAVGTFRKIPIPVPTREQAKKDAAALRQSEAWQSIQWQKSSPQENEKLRDGWIGKFIQKQAESIPAKKP